MLLKLVRAALWEMPVDLKGQVWTYEEYESVMTLARQQAVAGLVSQALMASGVKLERQDALELFGLQQSIRRRNAELDVAVVRLCQKMREAGIRIVVMKGQTLAALYSIPELRQSGDIDFYCHPEDWNKALCFIREQLLKTVSNHNTEKHVEFDLNGVQYEMHRMLTSFARPKHQRYWDTVVVPAIWEPEAYIKINDFDVPVLPPTYNVLYTFVHIFYHLIIEGIGLRQFCDWAVLLHEMYHGQCIMDNALLERHLKGIGLMKAYTGLGAILTDYLGLPEEEFPFEISADDHQKAPKLFQNMLEMGNFGHNKQYVHERGVLHGIQHLGRITLQARRFAHYAPAEAWWRIPYMFQWWGLKILRILKV